MANEILATMNGHTGYVCSVAFSPCGKQLASASADSKIMLWDTATHSCILSISGSVYRRVAFSPDGQIIGYSAGGNSDAKKKAGFLKVSDIYDSPLDFYFHRSTTNIVRTMAFKPDGKVLAVGWEEGEVQLIDVPTGESKGSAALHTARVHGVAFSSDGGLLVSGGEDKKVHLLDPITLAVRKKFTAHKSSVTSVAVSPDGRLLATGSEDRTAKVWDLNTLALKVTYDHSNFVNSVAFSPDGKVLATGSDDKGVRLWRVDV